MLEKSITMVKRKRSKKALFAFLILTTLTFGQGKTKEIGFISDNDLYTSSKYDMYYTNGLEFFSDSYLKTITLKLTKRLPNLDSVNISIIRGF